jgi:uncharacterized membrane protein
MPTIANLGDLAHLHLLLNHFPTIGTVLGLGLLLLSFVRKNDHLKKVSLEVFFIIALATLPVFMSGVAAQAALKNAPDVSANAIATHENAALLAFVLMEITGAAAWLGLWQMRRIARPARGSTGTVLVLSIVTVAVMAWAANLGGDIRHPEILSGLYSTAAGATDAPIGGGPLSAAAVKSFVLEHPWVWPTCETLHFLGMSLMFGVLMIVNLRLVGLMKGMSYASVHRLLPFGIMGFGINFVTGMMFFIGAPEQYIENVSFHWKMILLGLAGLNFLVLTVYDGAWQLPAGAEPPLSDKLLATSALVLALGVMYFGRMLPFIGNAF